MSTSDIHIDGATVINSLPPSTVQGISPDHKCPAFMAQLQLKNLQSRRTSDNVCMMTLMYSLKQSCWCPPYCRVTWAPNPLSLDNCHTAELLWHNWVLKVQGIHIMSMWSFHTWDSTESVCAIKAFTLTVIISAGWWYWNTVFCHGRDHQICLE